MAAKKSLESSKGLSMVLILQCTMCFVLAGLLIYSTLNARIGVDNLEKYVGEKKYYSLHDRADGIVYDTYMNSEKDYYKLKGFVSDLKERNDIEFISIICQPIDVEVSSIPEKFRYGYEEGVLEEPYSLDENSVEKFIGTKSIQVSGNIFNEFGLKAEEGNSFLEEDYILDKKKNIKVILGNEYKEFYKIGQNLNAFYLGEKVILDIVGILPKDSYIPMNGELTFLDRYVLMPSFDHVDYSENKDLAHIILSQQANGQIVTSDKELNVPEIVRNSYQKYGTFEFEIYEIGKSGIISAVNISRELSKELFMIMVFLIVFTVMGISVTIVAKIRENYHNYGIHLMCGATPRSILHQILIMIAIIVGVSLLLSLVILVPFTGIGLQHAMVALLSVTVLILSCISPVTLLKKVNVNNLIRRKE